MNDIKRKNVLYRLKPDSKLPYDSIDTITYDGTQLNSVTLNNTYNQLVDNDLFISHSIGTLAQHQVGPIQTNYDDMDDYQMGTKMWDNQANSVLSILHKVPVSIEDSISKVDGITGPVKHIFMYGSQLFVVTDQPGKNLYAPTDILGKNFRLVELGVSDYHINNYHIYSNGLLFATTDGVQHLVRQYNDKSDQFEYALSSFSSADDVTRLPDDDSNVQAVFFNRETGLLYASTLSSVYSSRFSEPVGPKNVLMFYKCLVKNQTESGDLIDATDVVANSIDSMYLSKYTFDNATLLLTNDGVYSTIAETGSALIVGKLLDGKNCYATFVIGDIALVGTDDGIYNLDGTSIEVKDISGTTVMLRNVSAFAANNGQLFVGSGNKVYVGNLSDNIFTITKTYSSGETAESTIIKIFIYSSKVGPTMYCFPIVLVDNGILRLLQPDGEPIITTPVEDLTFSTGATDAAMNTIAKTLYYVDGGYLKLKILDGVSDFADWSTAKLIKNDMITLSSGETILKSIDQVAITNKRLVNVYTGIECGPTGTIIDVCKVFQQSEVSYLALVKNDESYQITLISNSLSRIKSITINNNDVGESPKIAYMPAASFVLIYSGGGICLFSSIDDILNSAESITFRSSAVDNIQGLDFFASDSANVIGHSAQSAYEFSPIKALEQFSCNIPNDIRSVQQDDWLVLYNSNMISVAYLPTGDMTMIRHNDISSVQLNSLNGHIQLDVIENVSSVYSCPLNSNSFLTDIGQIFTDGKIYGPSNNAIIGYCPEFALYSDCIFGSTGISSLEPSESTVSQNESLRNATSMLQTSDGNYIPVSGDFTNYYLTSGNAVLYNRYLSVGKATNSSSSTIGIEKLSGLLSVANKVKDFCSLHIAVANSITDVGSDSVEGAADGIVYLTDDDELYYVNSSPATVMNSIKIDISPDTGEKFFGIDSIYSDDGIVLGITIQNADNAYYVKQYKIRINAGEVYVSDDPTTLNISSPSNNTKAWFGFRPDVMFYNSGNGIVMISNSRVTYYDNSISDINTTSYPAIIEQYAIGYTEVEEAEDDEDTPEEAEGDEDKYISNLIFSELSGQLYKNSDGQLYAINGSKYALLVENDDLEYDEAEPGVVLRYPIAGADYSSINTEFDISTYDSKISAIDSISEFGCEALIEQTSVDNIIRILPGDIFISQGGSAYEFTANSTTNQILALTNQIDQVICLSPTIVIVKTTGDKISVMYSKSSVIYTIDIYTIDGNVDDDSDQKTSFTADRMTHFNNSVIFDCANKIRQLRYATIVDAVQRDDYERTAEQKSIDDHNKWQKKFDEADEKDKDALKKDEPAIYQRQTVFIDSDSLDDVTESSLVPDSYSYAMPVSQEYRDNLNIVLGVNSDESGNMPAPNALIYYITDNNTIECESENYIGVAHQQISDINVSLVYFGHMPGRAVGTSTVQHILGVMDDGRIYDFTAQSIVSEQLNGNCLLYSGNNYYLINNADQPTLSIALDYPNVNELTNISCNVTPGPEKIISIASLGFSDVFICSKGIFSIDTDTKFSFNVAEQILGDIAADEIFSYGSDDVVYRNGSGLSSFTRYDDSHTSIDIRSDNESLQGIDAVYSVNDRISNGYKLVVINDGDTLGKLYYGKDFSNLIKYPDTRILTDDATVSGIFSLMNRLYIMTNKGIYYCDGYRDVTQFVRLDELLKCTSSSGTETYAECYTSTKIDPTQMLITTSNGLYRIYANNGHIFAKSTTVERSDSYPVAKVDVGTASAHDSGFVYFYPVASTRADDKGNSYTDFSIRTSKNGKRWTKFMSLSAIADSITGLSGFAAYDSGKYYIGTDNGVYLAKETYKLVNDIKKMTPDKLRSLYDKMGTSFSEIYSNALSQHKGSWHATGGTAYQLNNLMSRDCEGANLAAFVGNDNSSFYRDIFETVEFGKTSDGRIAVTVSNGVLNEANSEKAVKSETIICDYIIKKSATKFVEIYLHVPTTYTYYFSKPKGSAKFNEDKQSFVRPNLAGICNISLNGNPDQQFTSIQVRIADTGLTKQLILTDVQADGNSLPLNVYRDPTEYSDDGEIANMYRSLILPTVYRGYSDGAYNFACYGTDEQSLKLVFRRP